MRDARRKRMLVTGDAGFHESHLCERLLVDGHDVRLRLLNSHSSSV